MKHLLFCILAIPAATLACGPYFYPAPPTLDHYPERLPVKTMRELLRETQPPPADAATFDQLLEETQHIAGDLTNKSRDELRAAIDRTLLRNRVGDYRKRIANCLYDFRDLLESPDIPAAEVNNYVAWRAAAMSWDDGFFSEPPPVESNGFNAKQQTERRNAWQTELDKNAVDFRAEAEKSAPALKPHWLVQAGAWQFKHGRFEEAAKLFEQVIAESPHHPRAEVAQLMIARVRIEEWEAAQREAKSHDEVDRSKLWPKLDAARKALDAYVAAYPHGRFVQDIPGWRGGLAREDGSLDEAISSFLEQMDFADHPEIVRRAVRECESCFDALEVSKEDESTLGNDGPQFPLDGIARHPVAALALVYHFLDAESRRNFDELLERVDSLNDSDVTDRFLPPVVHMRRAGREILPALAAAVAKQKENYGGAVWRPKYLAILAWAASECDEQTQAIRLCDLAGPAIEGCDDLLFVRAVALQRAGRLDEAIAAFRRVQEKYPQSPLNNEIRFRISTALRDRHESGLALVEMARLELSGTYGQRQRWHQPYSQYPGVKDAPELHLESETAQWVDTMLQFAPLAELERALEVPKLEPEIAARLRQVLRLRYLAREDFSAAARFAEPMAAEPVKIERMNSRPVELTGDAWRKTVEDLGRLQREITGAAAPAVRAEKLFALAELWASLRGRLTLPSLDTEELFGSEFYKGWEIRYRNAQVAGFSAAAAAEELEQRDELRHAFRYYLQAADSAADKSLTARALWRANDALRRMAELSPWSGARAFEKNDSAASRQLHERLLRDCPASDEAVRLSVWWSFPPAAELRWMPRDEPGYDVEVAIADAFQGRTGDRYSSPQWEDNRAFRNRLQEVAGKAGTLGTNNLLDELAAIRRDFLAVYASPRGSWLMNHLDDLTLFLHEPGVTPSVRSKYFVARLAGGPPGPATLDDPEMQPWRDYLTFLALVREDPIAENPATGEGRWRSMSERMREFLEKFPKSRKREAALARLAIATVRETHLHCGVVNADWPEAPKLGGYKAMAVKHGVPFDAKRTFAALDAYEQEFPNGRYLAEIRLWRGVASIEAGDWKTAVDLLVATLGDQTNPDLHLDAALNLADVFMRLLDPPDARPEIIAAIRENPSARKRLHQFAHSETLGARLTCLEGYLDEQFTTGMTHQ